MPILTENCLPAQLAQVTNQNAVLQALQDCAGNSLSAGAQVALCTDITALQAAIAALPPPADGVSVTGGIINAAGELVLTMSDGSSVNAGVVKGNDGLNGTDGVNGLDGADGVGVQAWAVNPDGSQNITLTSGLTVNVPAPSAGAPGKEIVSLAPDGNADNLIISYSDGSSTTTDLTPLKNAIIAALPTDAYVQSASAYDVGTNILTLNLSDGSTVDLNFTALIQDALNGIGQATNTTQGTVALNDGTATGDADNPTDALTSSGLNSLLNQDGAAPNAVQLAVANALEKALTSAPLLLQEIANSFPVATDTVQGKVALNLGTAAGDDNNNEDALTSAGLSALLTSPTANGLQAAVAGIAQDNPATPSVADIATIAKLNPASFTSVLANDGSTVLGYMFPA